MKEIVDATNGVRYEVTDEVHAALVTMLRRTATRVRHLDGALQVEVRILDPGPRIIAVIKEVRSLLKLTLKESKHLVDAARRTFGGPPGDNHNPDYNPEGALLGTVDLPTALRWKARLEKAGATTNVPHPLEVLAMEGE